MPDGKNSQQELNARGDPHTPPEGGLDPLDRAFEDFWGAFPPGRKVGKGDARDAFRRIATGRHRRGLRATAETLIAAAAAYAATKPDPEFTPMPATWLNGGRWEDLAGPPGAPPSAGIVEGKVWGWWSGREDRLRRLAPERWREAFAKDTPNGVWPWWRYGPPPGHPDCFVPEEIVTERGWVEIYRGGDQAWLISRRQ